MTARDHATPPVHPSGANPLNGRYLAQNRVLHAVLTLIDRVRPPRESGPVTLSPAPRRVLLALSGHLGDAIILTAAIRVLRETLPDTEIGIVIPSWTRVVFERDQRIRWIHTVDHWKTNRAPMSLVRKTVHYVSTRRRALRSIRDVGYDVTIDTSAFTPNFAILLWQAGIPVRIGFTSGGFGGFYTHPVAWRDDRRHVAQRQLDLYGTLTPEIAERGDALRYELADDDEQSTAHLRAFLAEEGVEDGFVVVHMGAGAPQKLWDAANWRTIAADLAADGRRIVFTGRGAEEAALIRPIAGRVTGSVDASDRLDWGAFVALIRRAALVVTVDTAAGHVASAVGTPCVAIFTGVASPDHWQPLGERVEVVTNAVACAPCFRTAGCEAMTCIAGVPPLRVQAAIDGVLRGAAVPAERSRLVHPGGAP